MKTRTLIIITIFSLIATEGRTQVKGFSIGPYIEASFPTGDMKDANQNGWGAGFGADIRLGRLGLTGSAGYMHFGGQTVNTPEGPAKTAAIDAFPIRAGLKYRFAPLLYMKLEGGAANYTHGNGAAMIVSPGIGLRILGLDVQAKYEMWIKDGNHAFWGLKAGYNF